MLRGALADAICALADARVAAQKKAATPFSAAALCIASGHGCRGKEFRFLPGVRFQRAYPPRRTSLIEKIAVRKISCKDFLRSVFDCPVALNTSVQQVSGA